MYEKQELLDVEPVKPPVSDPNDHISFLRREYKTPPMFHPLAGTSINDMMTEFSKFDFRIIAIGYVLMVRIKYEIRVGSDRGMGSGSGCGNLWCRLGSET